MTFEEKRRLSQGLGSLPGDKLGVVMEIIAEGQHIDPVRLHATSWPAIQHFLFWLSLHVTTVIYGPLKASLCFARLLVMHPGAHVNVLNAVSNAHVAHGVIWAGSVADIMQEQEVEVNIDDLNQDTLWRLNAFINDLPPARLPDAGAAAARDASEPSHEVHFMAPLQCRAMHASPQLECRCAGQSRALVPFQFQSVDYAAAMSGSTSQLLGCNSAAAASVCHPA
jgi:hypothetical protein